MLELISIQEASQRLGYRDLRPTKLWLHERNIAFCKIGKELRIVKEDFENAFYSPIISFMNYKKENSSHTLGHRNSLLTILPTHTFPELGLESMRKNHNPLFLKKDLRVKGLYVFCGHCQRNVSDTCTEGGKLQECQFGKTHKFKGYAYVPNTKIRKVKIFDTEDPHEAAKLQIEFDKLVKQGRYEEIEKLMTAGKKEEAQKSQLLQNAMDNYISMLQGKSEYGDNESKSPGHISATERTYALFKEVLRKHNKHPEVFMIGEVSPQIVHSFINYLTKDKAFANNTFNRHIVNMRALFSFLKRNELFIGKNPFIDVKKRRVIPEVNIVDIKKLMSMLEDIKPENGIQVLGTSEKKNHYFPFLKNAYLIQLMTGLRRESLVNLSYSNIKEDEQGIPNMIEASNLKVNRIKGNKNNEEKAYIPIAPQLRDLLFNELDYPTNRNSQKFLIADDSNIQRKTMMNILSKSFSHFWKKKYPEEEAPKFSDLRKTFISKLTLAVGSNSRILTSHATQAILEKHYIRKQMIAEAASNANIFPELDETSDRINELKQLRESPKDQSKTIGK